MRTTLDGPLPPKDALKMLREGRSQQLECTLFSAFSARFSSGTWCFDLKFAGNARFVKGEVLGSNTNDELRRLLVEKGQGIAGCRYMRFMLIGSRSLAFCRRSVSSHGHHRLCGLSRPIGAAWRAPESLESPSGMELISSWIASVSPRVEALRTVFDAMPGDIFVLRNAGNTCTHAEGSMVGSLEFATGALKSRLILVLGHTQCGAIKGATATHFAAQQADPGATTSALQGLLHDLGAVAQQAAKEMGASADEEMVANHAPWRGGCHWHDA